MNKAALKAAQAAAHTTNGVRGNTAANIRTFNNAQIDALYLNAGSMVIWPGADATIPTGWKKCDGSVLSKTTYADLFAALGGELSPYGVQATTFNLPLMQNYATVVQTFIETIEGGERIINHLGEKGGEVSHVLTTSEMPSHSHSIATAPSDASGYVTAKASASVGGTAINTGASGLGQPHNNMSPYIAMNYIVKLD